MRMSLPRLPGLGRLAQILGLNAVPAVGFFGGGWSMGTALVVYWLETILVTLAVSCLILAHRRWTRKAGHWSVDSETRTTRGGKTVVRRGKSTYLTYFAMVMIPFTAAHGIFVALIATVLLPQKDGAAAGLVMADLRVAVPVLAAFITIGMILELPRLRERPFRWVERTAQRAMGRMFILHLTIIFGIWAMAATGAGRALFAVLVGFKLLFDLGGLLPQPEPTPQPPRWARWIDRVFRFKKGPTFAEHWRQTSEGELAQIAANEVELTPEQIAARLRAKSQTTS